MPTVTATATAIRRAVLALLLLAAPAAAADLELRFPVDCEVGIDCFVQNYVDVDPGPAARDYTCGPLTYDSHRGTDVRLLDRAAMRRGVAVLAAAAGTVSAIRDGEADDAVGFATSVAGRECGNGVWLTHGDGWSTRYCHMRRGSIAVAVGDTVATGQRLGEVGLSGATEFPHLHLSVHRHGQVVDPFTGHAGTNLRCDADTSGGLWAADVARRLAYRASGLLGAGFAAEVPAKRALEEGRFQDPTVPADAPALLFWARIFGLRTGDRQALSLIGPDGVVLAETAVDSDKTQAVAYRYVGKKRGRPRWPAGRYVGRYTLTRDGTVVVEVERILVMP